MVDDGLTGLFQTQFSTLLRMNLQQKTSKLRGKTEEGSHTGAKMASPIQLVPPMSMRTPEGRFAQKKNQGAVYNRRWIVPIDYEGDQYVDSFDQLKTPIDPKSQLVARAAAACARNWDSEIIRAATAASTIGTDAGSLTTEAFDTANYLIPANFGASTTSVGLTVDKLNEAYRMFEHAENDMEQMFTLVIGSKQHNDLRNQALVTSSDFNANGGVLENGKVKRFMGFEIVVSERLTTLTSNSSTCRGCIAFPKDGMYMGYWLDTKTEVFRRPDLSGNPWDINTEFSIGATRVEQGKVVQIACLDATGAPIDP